MSIRHFSDECDSRATLVVSTRLSTISLPSSINDGGRAGGSNTSTCVTGGCAGNRILSPREAIAPPTVLPRTLILMLHPRLDPKMRHLKRRTENLMNVTHAIYRTIFCPGRLRSSLNSKTCFRNCELYYTYMKADNGGVDGPPRMTTSFVSF